MSWEKEFASSITRADQIFSPEQLPSPRLVEKYPIRVPRSVLKKINDTGSAALARQFLPSDREMNIGGGHDDPIGDSAHFVAPQLIHRYGNRALFMPTSVCPINCRYCFRKNELNSSVDFLKSEFDKTLQYLADHSEIEEIIFTGGDPLVLSNEKIQRFLESFSQISSIKYIRFHTRTPIVIPSRVETQLVELLEKYSQHFEQIVMVIHCNHSDEIDRSVRESLARLPVNIKRLSQSVLLKGVNDSPECLEKLFRKLSSIGVTPYYLHHPDQAKGAMHFYLDLEQGRKIYGQLQNRLPGWMIPKYVIDIPGGHGKTPAYNPETFEFSQTLLSKSGEKIPVSTP